MSVVASAPGKLMLAGEYVVVAAGAPAIATAVDLRLSVRCERGGQGWRVNSRGLGLVEAPVAEIPLLEVVVELLHQLALDRVQELVGQARQHLTRHRFPGIHNLDTGGQQLAEQGFEKGIMRTAEYQRIAAGSQQRLHILLQQRAHLRALQIAALNAFNQPRARLQHHLHVARKTVQ